MTNISGGSTDICKYLRGGKSKRKKNPNNQIKILSLFHDSRNILTFTYKFHTLNVITKGWKATIK